MKNSNNKKIIWIAVLVAALAIFAVCAFLIVRDLAGGRTPNPDEYVSTTDAGSITSDDQTSEAEPALPDNPVDFAALQEKSPEIYAWISVPGTNVEYPILQSASDDLYYINHAFDGSYSVSGAVFTQSLNKKDFSDRNTLIYGHYMIDSTFFGTLHYFRDETFFNEHDTFFIYIPGHILTYKIFAAYEYDDRHILNSFDFSDDQVYADYLAACLDPKSVNRNVRAGTELTTNDKIVTLSTCTTLGEATLRYLVQGVFVSDEPTK